MPVSEYTVLVLTCFDMRIVIDHWYQPDGRKVGEVVVHTETADWNLVDHPDGHTGKVQRLVALHAYHTDPVLATAGGWDKLTDIPEHAGKTILQVFRDEIVRLNDLPARQLLGI